VSAFGRNAFPRRFGGGQREHHQEHIAMLDALAKGWDVSEETATYAETYAHAVGISFIWILNRRLANQSIPERMTDMLAEWETVCRLKPTGTDSVLARRRRVAAKLRGLAGNTLADITDACEKLLGASFAGLVGIAPTSVISYSPGINPGPPGLEWSSNRCVLVVRMTKNLLSEERFRELRALLIQMLDAMLPAWMTFRIGVGDSFIVNEGVIGATFL